MRNISFLFILSVVFINSYAQNIPYGNNPEAGAYFNVDGVKLYYEIYGEGEPILMLHGRVHGYISEFDRLISELSKTHQVICLATRGHGKSEIGHEPFSWEQRANDAYRLIEQLNLDSTLVIGFSDGGLTGLALAVYYPKSVIKLVAIGVGEKNPDRIANNSEEKLLARYNKKFTKMLEIMPEPERWNECLMMLNDFSNNDRRDAQMLKNIKCPVLLINGERDVIFPVEALVKYYRLIPNAQLAVIPDCHHVVFKCNFPAFWECTRKFIY